MCVGLGGTAREAVAGRSRKGRLIPVGADGGGQNPACRGSQGNEFLGFRRSGLRDWKAVVGVGGYRTRAKRDFAAFRDREDKAMDLFGGLGIAQQR